MNFTALGRYQIQSEIGRGNMGVVYRGHDPVIDRPVALKTIVLPESLGEGERRAFLERFFQEARTAGKLTHPHIVVTHDAADARALGERIAVLEAGRIVQSGSWAELAARPASDFVREFLSS